MAEVATKVITQQKSSSGAGRQHAAWQYWRLSAARAAWLLAGSWREYGDITRVKLGPMVMHQIVQPEYIRHVLVQNVDNYPKGFSHDKLRLALGNGVLTSESPLWDRQRRLMQPTYTPKAVTKFADIMVDSTDQMMERWNREHRAATC